MCSQPPPKDGRYGENPNRLQHYYQFQVVMKPNPVDIQEKYLESLRVLGIDTSPTTFALSKTTGNPQLWAPGAWVGKCG